MSSMYDTGYSYPTAPISGMAMGYAPTGGSVSNPIQGFAAGTPPVFQAGPNMVAPPVGVTNFGFPTFSYRAAPINGLGGYTW